MSEERAWYTTLTTLDKGYIPMPNYKFAKVDANHAIIRAICRESGYVWVDTYRQGDGCPDAFVLSKSKRWIALEIKSGDNKLTRLERELFDTVGAGPLYTVDSTEAVLKLLEFYDQKGE